MKRVLAFSFLRFREETGVPFRLGNVVEDIKAAGGAADRIAVARIVAVNRKNNHYDKQQKGAGITSRAFLLTLRSFITHVVPFMLIATH